MNFIIRPYNPETDAPFILNSWLKKYRHSQATQGIPHPIYYKEQRKRIEYLLNSGFTLILTTKEDPTQIVSYATFELNPLGALIIHFVYTKKAYRNLGFAKALYNQMLQASTQNIIFATHLTTVAQQIVSKQQLPVVYNPYLL